jgi:hypothetical protein
LFLAAFDPTAKIRVPVSLDSPDSFGARIMFLRKLLLSHCIALVAACCFSPESRAQIAPADPSFSSTDDVQALSHDFGTFRQGDLGASFNFAVFNRAAPFGTTSAASLSGVTSFGDTTAITLNTGNALHIPPSGQANMQLSVNTNQLGNVEALYTLSFIGDSVASPPIDLAIDATATVLRNGDYDADGDVDASDYVLWRKTLGQPVALGTGADGNKNGFVDQGDYGVWRANFLSPASGSSLAAGSTVPEPVALASTAVAFVATWLLARRRRS